MQDSLGLLTKISTGQSAKMQFAGERQNVPARHLKWVLIYFLVQAILLLLCVPRAGASSFDHAFLSRDLSPWGMFLAADITIKTVMITLLLASLSAWTVLLQKSLELRRETALVRQRLGLLETGQTLDQIDADYGEASDAVVQMIRSVVREAVLSGAVRDDAFRQRITLRLERVEAAAARQITVGTGLVASIGATAPFVGLFGTVWGIMNAFVGISQAHTTNLAVVAPGIAEALLATALGLVAAIPAVVIYNLLASRIVEYRALLQDASVRVFLLAR